MGSASARVALARRLGDHPRWRWDYGMPVALVSSKPTAVDFVVLDRYARSREQAGSEYELRRAFAVADSDDLVVQLQKAADGVPAGGWGWLDAQGAFFNAWPDGDGPLAAWWHPAMVGFLRARILKAAGDSYQARDAMARYAPRAPGWYPPEAYARVLLRLWDDADARRRRG